MMLPRLPQRPTVNSWPLWGIGWLLFLGLAAPLSKSRDEIERRAGYVCFLISTGCVFKMKWEYENDE